MISLGPFGLLLVLAIMCAMPTHARCPSGWWLPQGASGSGWYVCKPNAPIREGKSERGGYRDESVEPAGELYGRVYCTGGTRPVVVEGVAVGCMRGGWR